MEEGYTRVYVWRNCTRLAGGKKVETSEYGKSYLTPDKMPQTDPLTDKKEVHNFITLYPVGKKEVA